MSNDIDTKYNRVIPRDLFNEAKLLKCMGHLCLKIHDHMTPIVMEIDEEQEDGEPIEAFNIGLMDEGYLAIDNLYIRIKDRPYLFKTQYNSKANFPLFIQDDDCEYRVFDERGEWDSEFLEFCNNL